MGAAEHQGVHAVGLQRREVALGQAQDLPAGGDAALDEVDEPRAVGGGDVDAGHGVEKVLVGPRADRRGGADDPDLAVARGRHRAPHGGQDHLDDGDRVPLAGVAQEGGRRGVAGDDDHLAAALDEVVGDGLGVPAHVGDAQRTVGPVGGVADVDHRFVRQLVDDRSRHRQPADAGVEHPDRCGAVDFQLAVVMLVDAHRPALPRLSMDAAMIPPMAPNRCICQLTPISVGNTPQIRPE